MRETKFKAFDGQVYFNCTCTNGYIATQVSADEWLESKLADLRFTRSTDDGQECLIGIRFDEKEA